MNPEILIYGPIGSGGVTADQIAVQLRAAGTGPVTVRVNSPGGCAFDGLAIYNLIKAHGNVTAIVDGIAASAAGYGILGAKRIEMAPDSLFMIHPPHSAESGEADDFRETADLLDKTEKQIAAIYARRSGKNAAQVSAWLSGQTWFTAAEALAASLIDAISTDAPRAGIKMEFSYAFNSAPAAIAARFITAPAAVEVDPVKAELVALKATIAAKSLTDRISAKINPRLHAGLRAAIIKFAATDEASADTLIQILSSREPSMDEMRRQIEEERAVAVAESARIPGYKHASEDTQYDGYMQRLKKSRT